MRSRLLIALVMTFACLTARAQRTLAARNGHDAGIFVFYSHASPIDTETSMTIHARWSDTTRGFQHATLWLSVTLSAAGELPPGTPREATIRIPLSSTDDVYGESRSCTANRAGSSEPYTLLFTAGMDEQNFMPVQMSSAGTNFSFLLNKYICRLLAAPFDCAGKAVTWAQAPEKWRVTTTSLRVSTDGNIVAEGGDVALHRSATRFDYARCAVVAPSNGMCCVVHKQTEWHCGGTPAGDGWHQVSGECFHRETGASCSE